MNQVYEDFTHLKHLSNANKLWIAGDFQGRIQDFKLGGAQLKKLRRAEGGAKIFGVFRVKNHDFTPKKSYFYQFTTTISQKKQMTPS